MKPQAKTTKRKAPVKRSPEFKRRKTNGIPPMSPELSSEGRTRLQLGECAPKHQPFEYDLTPETLRQRIDDVKYPFGTAPKDASPVPGWKTELPPIKVDWQLPKSVLSIPVPAAKKIPLWRVWCNAFLDTFK